MGRKKKEKLEFRVYEIPPGESVLALLGDDWIGNYGYADTCMHFHNLFEIGYCHYGHGLLVLGEEEQVYEDGMISAIPADFPHITVSEGVDSWEFLFFDPAELIKELFPGQPGLQIENLARIDREALLFREKEQPELAATVRKVLREMHRKRPFYQETVRHLMQIYLLELLRVKAEAEEGSGAVRIRTGSIAQIQPAIEYVEQRYFEEIRASQLAARCGLSEAQFRRVFEESVHMAPIEYLNRIRIYNACKLMNRRDCSMDVVAEECGFSSLSAFTRNFKKIMKTTPYQWKLNKENYRGQLQQFEISTLRGWKSL